MKKLEEAEKARREAEEAAEVARREQEEKEGLYYYLLVVGLKCFLYFFYKNKKLQFKDLLPADMK